jgi:hypothetical protein
MESIIIESYKLEDILSTILDGYDLFKGDAEALKTITFKFKVKFKDSFESNCYEMPEETFTSFVEQCLRDLTDEALLGLVNMGLVDMSVDNEGEATFQLKEGE